jgi:hypothetical protein
MSNTSVEELNLTAPGSPLKEKDRVLQEGAPPALNGGSMAPTDPNKVYVVDRGPAPILKSWSSEDHRRRLLNIQAAERGIRKCLKKHLITNYLPGQVSYNLGEYPSRAPYDPDEYDDNELARLAASGVQLLQVMEDWNDLLNLHGADRFSSPNPAGMHRFINMAHNHGIKVLIYASTGYMQEDDPDMNLDWTAETAGNGNHAAHWKLIRSSPASPGWREFMLRKTVGILEEYPECDGLYNDWGYVANFRQPYKPAKDDVEAFIETAEHDAAKEDLCALVYAEVKRRGGIYKFHADFNDRPMFQEKIYDYLWVGECVGDLEKMRNETKLHPPYVIPCFDCRFGEIISEDHQYLHTIPYMQFPQLLAGRPFTGERAMIPGVHYRTEETDDLLREWRTQWRYFQENQDGPYIYGPWDHSPVRPGIRETHTKWLKQYLPIVTEGSYAYLEITDSDLFKGALPAGVVASLFVNLENYLVLANYGTSEVTVETAKAYVPTDDSATVAKSSFTLASNTFVILREIQ